MYRFFCFLFSCIFWSHCAVGEEDHFVTLASTTSTQDSGLYEYLLPLFNAATGVETRVVAVGTGQALQLARNGDADVVIVHHESSEQKFVDEGFALGRFDLMYNDYILLGPSRDPAGIGDGDDVIDALGAIAASESMFTSRGDDSGTHRREIELWEQLGATPSPRVDRWYRDTGSGMGSTLNVASELDAYVLSDRATWLRFSNKGNLQVLVQGDPRLFNQYGVMLVSPDQHPHVNHKGGEMLVDWLLSDVGQAAIDAYLIDGSQAFHANAGN